MGYVETAAARGIRLDDYDRRTLQILDQHGWMVQQVLGDESNPPFAYTVGATLHRPDLIPWEVMVVGIDLPAAKQVLNALITRAIEGGERIAHGRIEDLLADGLVGYLGEIPADRVTAEWFGYGLWFARQFGDGELRMAQFVWPDAASGRLPWEPPEGELHDGDAWADQPLLCDPAIT